VLIDLYFLDWRWFTLLLFGILSFLLMWLFCLQLFLNREFLRPRALGKSADKSRDRTSTDWSKAAYQKEVLGILFRSFIAWVGFSRPLWEIARIPCAFNLKSLTTWRSCPRLMKYDVLFYFWGIKSYENCLRAS
jgi:hypothetical protein